MTKTSSEIKRAAKAIQAAEDERIYASGMALVSAVKERDIRKELKRRVEANGGSVRAVAWIGRRHAPDVLCLFPESEVRERGVHLFVETKAPGGVPNAGQLREHERLRESGCVVLVISTFEQLDAWMLPT